MAEAIGLIASVIQVAGAGLKLSQTLYQYADGVATADRRIKDIAKEIQLTSFVIEELGDVFKHDETSTLMSKNAVKTANETMKECSSVFAEIDATLKKSKKNTLGRLMLPFRDTKIELLRNHIDKLKSTLQLLMQVLTHAHQVATKKLDREAEAKQKAQIQELIELKKQSTKKYEESLRNISLSDGSTIIDPDEADSDKENLEDDSVRDLPMAAAAIGSTITSKTLATCVQHVRSLLEDIETLQQALTTKVDGDDHSEHHQSLIGSYFRARDHLDSILFRGSAQNMGDNVQGRLSIASVSSIDAQVDIQRVTTSSNPNEGLSKQATLIEVESANVSQGTEQKTQIEEAPDPETRLDELYADRENQKKDDTKEVRKSPIKFQDTLGRLYYLPFHTCQTWERINKRIERIYNSEDFWKHQVTKGHFDILDHDGYAILDEDWEDTIEPGMSLTMRFWTTSLRADISQETEGEIIAELPSREGYNQIKLGEAQPQSNISTEFRSTHQGRVGYGSRDGYNVRRNYEDLGCVIPRDELAKQTGFALGDARPRSGEIVESPILAKDFQQEALLTSQNEARETRQQQEAARRSDAQQDQLAIVEKITGTVQAPADTLGDRGREKQDISGSGSRRTHRHMLSEIMHPGERAAALHDPAAGNITQDSKHISVEHSADGAGRRLIRPFVRVENYSKNGSPSSSENSRPNSKCSHGSRSSANHLSPYPQHDSSSEDPDGREQVRPQPATGRHEGSWMSGNADQAGLRPGDREVRDGEFFHLSHLPEPMTISPGCKNSATKPSREHERVKQQTGMPLGSTADVKPTTAADPVIPEQEQRSRLSEKTEHDPHKALSKAARKDQQDQMRTDVLQAEIDATVAIMHENINKVSERGERLDSLQEKTDDLSASAASFRRAADKHNSYWSWGKPLAWLTMPFSSPTPLPEITDSSKLSKQETPSPVKASIGVKGVDTAIAVPGHGFATPTLNPCDKLSLSQGGSFPREESRTNGSSEPDANSGLINLVSSKKPKRRDDKIAHQANYNDEQVSSGRMTGMKVATVKDAVPVGMSHHSRESAGSVSPNRPVRRLDKPPFYRYTPPSFPGVENADDRRSLSGTSSKTEKTHLLRVNSNAYSERSSSMTKETGRAAERDEMRRRRRGGQGEGERDRGPPGIINRTLKHPPSPSKRLAMNRAQEEEQQRLLAADAYYIQAESRALEAGTRLAKRVPMPQKTQDNIYQALCEDYHSDDDNDDVSIHPATGAGTPKRTLPPRASSPPSVRTPLKHSLTHDKDTKVHLVSAGYTNKRSRKEKSRLQGHRASTGRRQADLASGRGDHRTVLYPGKGQDEAEDSEDSEDVQTEGEVVMESSKRSSIDTSKPSSKADVFEKMVANAAEEPSSSSTSLSDLAVPLSQAHAARHTLVCEPANVNCRYAIKDNLDPLLTDMKKSRPLGEEYSDISSPHGSPHGSPYGSPYGSPPISPSKLTSNKAGTEPLARPPQSKPTGVGGCTQAPNAVHGKLDVSDRHASRLQMETSVGISEGSITRVDEDDVDSLVDADAFQAAIGFGMDMNFQGAIEDHDYFSPTNEDTAPLTRPQHMQPPSGATTLLSPHSQDRSSFQSVHFLSSGDLKSENLRMGQLQTFRHISSPSVSAHERPTAPDPDDCSGIRTPQMIMEDRRKREEAASHSKGNEGISHRQTQTRYESSFRHRRPISPFPASLPSPSALEGLPESDLFYQEMMNGLAGGESSSVDAREDVGSDVDEVEALLKDWTTVF